jgi:hypothetical protein
VRPRRCRCGFHALLKPPSQDHREHRERDRSSPRFVGRLPSRSIHSHTVGCGEVVISYGQELFASICLREYINDVRIAILYKTSRN